jgi:hypothetical protein
MNTLVWGLYWHEKELSIYKFNNKFWTYINYYRLSIKHAKDLGYDCHFYLSENIQKYFTDLNINLHIVDFLTPTFYDSINFYILETEHSTCPILDGDIIMYRRLPELNADVIYDMPETNSWDWLYEFWVSHINDRGIKDIIPEWTGKKRNRIINIGLLQIKNTELLNLYKKRWNDFRVYIESNIDNLKYKGDTVNTIEYTTMASQYILTELVDYYNYTHLEYKSLNRIEDKPIYKHFVGTQKFTNNLVPYDKIITFKTESIL